MSDQPMLYTIRIPGALYGGLQERNAFENDNPTDRDSLKVLKAAQRIKAGKGYRYILTGERRVLMDILDYVFGLAELVGDGILTASELGASRTRLLAVADQRPTPVKRVS